MGEERDVYEVAAERAGKPARWLNESEFWVATENTPQTPTTRIPPLNSALAGEGAQALNDALSALPEQPAYDWSGVYDADDDAVAPGGTDPALIEGYCTCLDKPMRDCGISAHRRAAAAGAPNFQVSAPKVGTGQADSKSSSDAINESTDDEALIERLRACAPYIWAEDPEHSTSGAVWNIATEAADRLAAVRAELAEALEGGPDVIGALARRCRTAEARIAAVRALHEPHVCEEPTCDHKGWCRNCWVPMPCPTARALGSSTGTGEASDGATD